MPIGRISPVPRKTDIVVSELIKQLEVRTNLKMEVCAGEEAIEKRLVTEEDLHRPGLALAGYVELFTSQRVQVIGNTETSFLQQMDAEGQKKAFLHLMKPEVPAIFLTDGNELPSYLLKMAGDMKIPVFRTHLETTKFMFRLRDFLEDQFAEHSVVHGSMVDVYGIGIMIAGKSGIGKSEVALDLIERGHRLVADDVIMLTNKNNVLMATASDMNQHFMEIRGLGIVDVMSMFGIRAIRYQKRLEVVVELFIWDKDADVDRTGLNRNTIEMLGVDIPYIRLPITPGKNITVIAEVIAMNHLLSHYGYDAAKEFQSKLNDRIARRSGRPGPRRAVEYFEGDIE